MSYPLVIERTEMSSIPKFNLIFDQLTLRKLLPQIMALADIEPSILGFLPKQEFKDTVEEIDEFTKSKHVLVTTFDSIF